MVSPADVPLLAVQDTPGYSFTGDPDDMVLVTTGCILSGLLPVCSPSYQLFLNVCGDSQQTFYATKGEILSLSADTANQFMFSNAQFTPETIWNYYAVACLASDFTLDTGPPGPDTWCCWSVFGTVFQPTGGAHCIQPAPIQSNWRGYLGSGIFFGPMPIISAPNPGYNYCPNQTWCSLHSPLDDALEVLYLSGPGPTDSWWTFRPGALTIVPLNFYHDTGSYYVPLPPIPDGFTIPPPLAGQINPCDSTGPPGPEGPAGECIGCMSTFADVVAAAGDPTISPATFQLFAEETGLVGPLNADLLTDVVVSMSTEALDDLCNYLVDSETGIFFPGPQLTCSGSDESSFTVGTSETGGPQYQLTVPCASDLPMDPVIVTFDTNQCGDDDTPGNVQVVGSITAPFLAGTDGVHPHVYDQSDLFGLILSKLDSLLKCCPPCDTGTTTQDFYTIEGTLPNQQAAGEWDTSASTGGSTWGVDAVIISGMATSVPIDTTLGVTGIGKLGRLWWIFDCFEYSEPVFINFDGQKLLPGAGNVIGFKWHMNYGVNGTFLIKDSPRPGPGQW